MAKKLCSAQLKKAWKTDIKYGGFTGGYRDWLQQQAARADDRERYRAEGTTYADAAYLLLERK